MNDVTDLRIRKALAEVLDATPVVRPLHEVLQDEPPVRMITPPTRTRTGLYLALAAAALLLAVIAWPRGGKDTVTTDTTVTTSETLEPTTTVETTTTDDGSTTSDATTTTVPQTTISVEPAPDHVFDDFVEPAIGDVATKGGPLQLDPLPEGWTQIYAGDEAPAESSGPPLTPGWSATLQPLGSTSERMYPYPSFPYVTLTVEHLLAGDRVAESIVATERTFGEWTGWVSEPTIGRNGSVLEVAAFASALPGDRRLLISGYTDEHELTSILAALDRTDVANDDSFDTSRLRESYDVSESSAAVEDETEHLWRTGYQTPSGQFVVTVRLHMTQNLANRAEPPVRAGTWTGFASPTYALLYPTPDVSIEFSGATGLTDLASLVALGEDLTPIQPEAWSALLMEQELRDARPPVPDVCIDANPTVIAVRIDGASVDPGGIWTAEPGDDVELDLMMAEGVSATDLVVTASSRYGTGGKIAELDDVTGTRTVSFTWNGQVNGKAVPAGRYALYVSGTIATFTVTCPQNYAFVGMPTSVSLTGAFAIYE